MQDRTVKLIIIIALVFSIISISACIFMYQKVGDKQIAYKANVSANNPVAIADKDTTIQATNGNTIVYNVKIPEKAGGFLGLAESQSITMNGDNKKIQLRGHWTVDNKPTFDFIGDSDYKEASGSLPLKTIIVNKNTKIEKSVITVSANREPNVVTTEVPFTDLKIESLEDPIFAVFAGQTNTGQAELVAVKLVIYPGFSQIGK